MQGISFKILQEFLLPSVFIFIFISAGLILIRRKKKTGRALVVLGISIYYLFSIAPVADFILQPLENRYQRVGENELEKADKIILLLGGREGDILRASEVLRIYHEKPILNNKSLKIIVSGTNPFLPEIDEAEEVKSYLIERGIAPEDIILEEKSRNTRESAENAGKLVGKEPFFLATSSYHMPRSMEAFRKMGCNPIPAPTDFKIERARRQGAFILDFFPGPENLRKTNLAFHEYFGILFYRLF